MVIGIDIDDTMTNHLEVWFELYNTYNKEENEEPLKPQDAYKWGFYDNWTEENKQNLISALNNPEYFDKLQLLPNVSKVIDLIIGSGNKIIIISSTDKELQESKKRWLLERLPNIKEDDIIFTVNKELINVDMMIDDNLIYAKKFKCPFLLYKQPWNTGRPTYEYSDNIINVGNWNDIEDILTNMGIINIQVTTNDEGFTEATKKLIQGIKEAKTDEECVNLLNPYIKMWQQQGMLIGMKQINDATLLVVEDIIKELNEKKIGV